MFAIKSSTNRFHETSIELYDNKTVAKLVYYPVDHFLWIETIYVLPQYRRQKLAHFLLQKLINDYPKKEFRLCVHPIQDKPMSIRQLIKFYKKYQFEYFTGSNVMIRYQQ